MPILKSCCFWNNVRQGSYASIAYTLIYFLCSCLVLATYLVEERQYLTGEIDRPTGESFLEQGNISPIAVIFNIIFLGCSVLLVMASLLAIAALKTDKRLLLLPWIVLMIAYILFEFSHLIYWSSTQTVIFDPIMGFLFTVDFFLMCLNLYCLVCVISQYQEYLKGRGHKSNDINIAVRPHVSRNVGKRTKSYRPSHTTTISNNFTANIKSSKISTIPEEATKNRMEYMEKDEFSILEEDSSRSGHLIQSEIKRQHTSINIPIITLETSVSDTNIKNIK